MNTTNFVSQRTLYCENLDNFMNTRKSDFIEMMEQNIMTHSYAVGDSPKKSWKAKNSALKEILRKADLPKDVVIAFEYQIDTVERLQRQDVDVIILSTSVSDLGYYKTTSSFIEDANRLNVIFSRAKKKVVAISGPLVSLPQ